MHSHRPPRANNLPVLGIASRHLSWQGQLKSGLLPANAMGKKGIVPERCRVTAAGFCHFGKAFSTPPEVALIINVYACASTLGFKFASALRLMLLQICWHPIWHNQGSSCRRQQLSWEQALSIHKENYVQQSPGCHVSCTVTLSVALWYKKEVLFWGGGGGGEDFHSSAPLAHVWRRK